MPAFFFAAVWWPASKSSGSDLLLCWRRSRQSPTRRLSSFASSIFATTAIGFYPPARRMRCRLFTHDSFHALSISLLFYYIISLVIEVLLSVLQVSVTVRTPPRFCCRHWSAACRCSSLLSASPP